MLRTSLLTATAAVWGWRCRHSVAIPRSGLVIAFGWIALLEGMIRGFKPGLARFLWGENMTIILSWAQLDNVSFRRGPAAALITVTLYAAAIVVAATWVFQRRDVASAS